METENKETRALDALIAAAFKAVEIEETVTDSDVADAMSAPVQLSEEDTIALKSLGDSIFSGKIPDCSSVNPEPATISSNVYECDVVAMNRKNASDIHEEEIEKRIKQAREELLRKIKELRDKNGSNT